MQKRIPEASNNMNIDIQKNLSQLFYIKNNSDVQTKELHSFERKLNEFYLSGDLIHGFNFKQYYKHPQVSKDTSFSLTTIYPGLLLGVGYSHPALHDIDPNNKKDESDFQIGFFFDHTTGLPVIPGSSVKGVLKSVFPKPKFDFKAEKLDYIKSLFPEDKRHIIDFENWQNIFFERKQIFLDAYFSELPSDGKILEDDYITPHTAGIFKEPNPIRFLKISPGVKFTFQFILFDYKDKDGKVLLTAKDIKDVFKKILIDFGIGAKRNVGYGQFK
jgi:CRISPR-associated protein Cmr6